MTAAINRIGRVGHKQGSWDEVRGEIDHPERFPLETSYVLLERTEHIEFVTKAQACAKELFAQHWSAGRVFNDAWELQFAQHGSGYLLCLLTEGELPAGWASQEFETGPESSLLLFGERRRDTDPGWREARIPRWLEYPVEKAIGRVRLVAVPYCRAGMTVRMRFKGVKSQ
ncbi:MAG TPA: hypothetical protein VNP04_25350 [Alphaproteobacteria bacterium]|nr:hypothetical protein [Alphaproteobacteria bacterium]